MEGCVITGALASGDLLQFGFRASHPGAGLLAAAAVPSGGQASQQSRRQADADVSLLPGSMLWLPADGRPPPGAPGANPYQVASVVVQDRS